MTDLRAELQAALGGAYTLERELTGGGMSRVFVAQEIALGRTVVVKVIAPELAHGLSAERFTREVRLAARLQQANIVPVLAAGDTNGIAWYTMPFVRGESLRTRFTAGGKIPLSEGVSIVRDVVRALAYAHGDGIVHRDIKPDNILLSGGTAVVTDFGIAKALSASRTLDGTGGADATLTQAGNSLGTPAYMAPEQALGDTVDHRADLYAWGVLAYEVLGGAHPFGRCTTAQQYIAAHITETPRPLAALNPDVPRVIADVVMRCLAKAPTDRPESAATIVHELEVASTPSEQPLAARSRTAVVRRPSFRRNLMLGMVAAGVLALATLAVRRGRAPRASAQVAPADRSIAVLPLANLSGDKSDDYFGIGLAEEITRALSKTGLRVIGRVSAGALQVRGLDERAIAKELGVGSLLTGSVQRADGQVRINVSLLSASDGAVRWTEKYDRPLKNVFAVQDEIARSVSGKLLGSLGAAAPTTTRIETSDPEAYALFLQGQVLFNRRTAETLSQAIGLYERAVKRDPQFARAQASLAMALTVLPLYAPVRTESSLARVTAAARRAIAIDSTIAESYAALAYSTQLAGRNRAADALFQQALAHDSTMATAWGWYGLLALQLGDFAAAHRREARARELEPASLIARVWDAQVLLQERRFAAADSASVEMLALDSTFALGWTIRAEALLFEGRTGESVTILQRRVALLAPNLVSETHGRLAFAYARSGQVAKARTLLQHLRELSGGRLPATGLMAATLEELGEHEAAIAQLGLAVNTFHDGWITIYSRGQTYDKLRRDPRAAAMLARIESL